MVGFLDLSLVGVEYTVNFPPGELSVTLHLGNGTPIIIVRQEENFFVESGSDNDNNISLNNQLLAQRIRYPLKFGDIIKSPETGDLMFLALKEDEKQDYKEEYGEDTEEDYKEAYGEDNEGEDNEGEISKEEY